jgi:ADP-ribose 1''-phosphate phosphatase
MIEYRKGNLFDAPKGSMLLHACNCMGVWGSGVALTFKQKFPKAFGVYNRHCYSGLFSPVGTSLTIPDTDFIIGCLFTSHNYGKHVSPPDVIIKSTIEALNHLLSDDNLGKIQEIHSPKINSGLFRVPWEETEKVINDILPKLNKKWVVWEL